MKTASEIQREGWQALVERLGLADALRFMVFFMPGKGDYLMERERLFGDKSLSWWLEELRRWDKEK